MKRKCIEPAGACNDQGRAILRFAQDHGIPLIEDLDTGLTLSDVRDVSHLHTGSLKNPYRTVLSDRKWELL